MISFGFWMSNKNGLAVITAACAVILGTPFAIIILVPMAIDCLIRNGLIKVMFWGLVGLFISLVPSVLVDYHYYGKWLVSVFNIVFYNALSGDTSSVLYGVEPWTYYIKNLFLNFNIAIFLFFICLPVIFYFFIFYFYIVFFFSV
jgi:alpha-1,2-mannosyltransferase